MTDFTPHDLARLARQIAGTCSDECDCGTLHQALAQVAELKAQGADLSLLMPAVQHHLDQCPCCHAELTVLLRTAGAGSIE